MPVKSAGSNLTLVVTFKAVRAMALALPEATESDHWGHPSFRIYGRIFVTVPDSAHLNVMIDPFDVEAAVREEPEACSELWWGKEVRGVRVDLQKASREVVANLLEVAWRCKAPRRLINSEAHQKRPPPSRM
jgi:hypothetical protein